MEEAKEAPLSAATENADEREWPIEGKTAKEQEGEKPAICTDAKQGSTSAWSWNSWGSFAQNAISGFGNKLENAENLLLSVADKVDHIVSDVADSVDNLDTSTVAEAGQQSIQKIAGAAEGAFKYLTLDGYVDSDEEGKPAEGQTNVSAPETSVKSEGTSAEEKSCNDIDYLSSMEEKYRGQLQHESISSQAKEFEAASDNALKALAEHGPSKDVESEVAALLGKSLSPSSLRSSEASANTKKHADEQLKAASALDIRKIVPEEDRSVATMHKALQQRVVKAVGLISRTALEDIYSVQKDPEMGWKAKAAASREVRSLFANRTVAKAFGVGNFRKCLVQPRHA
mmetsp:Transcript_4293/g.12951  ORF Transcript_4293/g.12951 Transcript_4293/m.12951 type:complete len:343 (+) Transcript_4293:158-1186(+)